MKTCSIALLVLALLGAGAACSQPFRQVDDSYTIAQRYEGYKTQYPGLTLPVSEFVAGQKILFDRTYKSTSTRDLHADVFIPAPKVNRRQGLVLVHGGAWRSGTKSHFYAIANLLAQRGYTVILPEYRLSPEAGYPAGLIDVNDAIVWAKRHASDFGIDDTRIALGGASSGGQMAALVAYTANTSLFKSDASDDTRVNALIDLDGVLDFTTPLALRYENAAGSQSPAALWLGGSKEQAPQRWEEASAAKHVSPDSPPTLIISSGQARFTAGREDVEAALTRFNIRNRYFAFDNAPHDVWLFEPYLSQIVEKVDTFLRPGS